MTDPTENQLREEVDRYNKYMDSIMAFSDYRSCWYTLFIDGREITSGDIYDLIDRVRCINRENGLTYL